MRADCCFVVCWPNDSKTVELCQGNSGGSDLAAINLREATSGERMDASNLLIDNEMENDHPDEKQHRQTPRRRRLIRENIPCAVHFTSYDFLNENPKSSRENPGVFRFTGRVGAHSRPSGVRRQLGGRAGGADERKLAPAS